MVVATSSAEAALSWLTGGRGRAHRLRTASQQANEGAESFPSGQPLVIQNGNSHPLELPVEFAATTTTTNTTAGYCLLAAAAFWLAIKRTATRDLMATATTSCSGLQFGF